MKEQLTKLGFNDWLLTLELAPYPVMFWDTPKFIQLNYIKKWLRDKYHTEVFPDREDDYWIIKIVEFKSGNKYNKLLFQFNSYDEALEIGIDHVIDKL